jgi:hypothetical protein
VTTDVARRRHWETFHRFFSRGTWDPDRLGYWVFRRVQRQLGDGVVRAVLDASEGTANGVKITDKQMKTLALVREEFHGEWNYCIEPRH